MKRLLLCLLAAMMLLAAACSLPPERPISLDRLMATRVYSLYTIEESPEEVLAALNRDGEVILLGKRKVGKKEYPVYVKVLATSDGIEISDYER